MRTIGEPSPGDYESSLSREGDSFSFFSMNSWSSSLSFSIGTLICLPSRLSSVTKPFATRTNLALMWVPLVLVHVR